MHRMTTMIDTMHKHRGGALLYGNQRGMTLVEVMTVLVIIALLALFAGPELMNWKPRMLLKRASDDLFTNMQLAKVHAVKNNVDVYVAILPDVGCAGTGGSYEIGEVAAGTIIASGAMADGVCISAMATLPAPAAIPVSAADRLLMDGFTSRGLSIRAAGGNVTLTHPKVPGKQYDISMSVAGGVTID